MAIGDYTVGQAPGQNQVDLTGGRNAMKALFASAGLGNNVANPMAGIMQSLGDSSLGYQNAIANSRMAKLGLANKEQELAQAEKQFGFDQQEPGVTDFLGTLLSGAGAFKNGMEANDQNNLLKQLFGMSTPGSQSDYDSIMLSGLPGMGGPK